MRFFGTSTKRYTDATIIKTVYAYERGGQVEPPHGGWLKVKTTNYQPMGAYTTSTMRLTDLDNLTHSLETITHWSVRVEQKIIPDPGYGSGP